MQHLFTVRPAYDRFAGHGQMNIGRYDPKIVDFSVAAVLDNSRPDDFGDVEFFISKKLADAFISADIGALNRSGSHLNYSSQLLII